MNLFKKFEKKNTENLNQEKSKKIPEEHGKEKGGYIIYPGYFGKVIQLKSIDFFLQDEVEQDFTIKSFETALKYLEVNFGGDLVKVERPIILDKFADELREKFYKKYEEKDKLRANILLSRMDDIVYYNTIEKVTAPFFYLVVYSDTKAKLNDIVAGVTDNLIVAGIYDHVLTGKEIAVFLKYTTLNDFDEREIVSAEDLKAITPGYVKFKKDSYCINEKFASVIAIKEYPMSVDNGWGDNIFNMQDVKVVMHIKPLDSATATKRLDVALRELRTKDKQAKDSEEMKLENHQDSMYTLLSDLQTENQILFDVSLTVTCYADTEKELAAIKKKIIQKLKNEGMAVDGLYFQQQNGYINSNISAITKLKRLERGINSTSLAAVFPFTSPLTLEPGGIMLGMNEYPFILDLWKRGDDYQNSNAFVVGTAGSGKSFFVKTLLMNLYSDNCDIFILDPENEYSVSCANLRGTYIDVGNSTKGRINPFHIYNVLTEDGKTANGAVIFSAQLRMLESFYKLVFEGASSEVLEVINDVTILTYRKKHIDETLELDKLNPKDFPTFEDLYQELINQETITKSEIIKVQIQKAIMYVKKFVGSGRYAQVWNGYSTLKADTDFTVFNFQTLFANKNQVVANAQMLLVFKFLEQEIINRRERNMASGKIKHTVIVADEAHLFIDPKFPIALDFFYQMTKRIRKYGGSFIPVTQSISDWNANEELAHKTTAILKESQYNFVLHLRAPGVKDLADLYSQGNGINESEQRSIVTAKRGSMFFIGNEKFHTFFDVVPSEYVQMLFENKDVSDDMFDEAYAAMEETKFLKENDIDINIEKSESEQENDAQSEENSEDNKSIEKTREEVLEKHKLVKKQQNSTVAKFATTQNKNEFQEIENTEEKIKQDTGKGQLKTSRKQQRTKKK